jgi:hypothetical protein
MLITSRGGGWVFPKVGSIHRRYARTEACVLAKQLCSMQEQQQGHVLPCRAVRPLRMATLSQLP